MAMRQASILGSFCAWMYLVPASVGAADAQHTLDKNIQQEIAVLRSCVPQSCPVFFVSALGRQLAIPDRFKEREFAAGFRRFISPARETVPGKIAAGEVLVGGILFGPLEELRKGESSGDLKLRRLRSAHGVEIHALSVGQRTDEFAQVLIAGDEYIQISDQNKQLPELLLELSARLASSK